MDRYSILHKDEVTEVAEVINEDKSSETLHTPSLPPLIYSNKKEFSSKKRKKNKFQHSTPVNNQRQHSPSPYSPSPYPPPPSHKYAPIYSTFNTTLNNHPTFHKSTPQPIILDTSAVSNPDSYTKLGNTSTHAFVNILKHMKGRNIPLYMSCGCYKELKDFINLDNVNKHVLSTLHVVDPDRDGIRMSGASMYDLVCEFRRRGDCALKYATKLLREAYAKVPLEKKKGIEDPVGPLVVRLRDGFRNHTRTNFVDSGQDMDALLLTKQLKGRLATFDKGMVHWASRLGIEVVDPHLLIHL